METNEPIVDILDSNSMSMRMYVETTEFPSWQKIGAKFETLLRCS